MEVKRAEMQLSRGIKRYYSVIAGRQQFGLELSYAVSALFDRQARPRELKEAQTASGLRRWTVMMELETLNWEE